MDSVIMTTPSNSMRLRSRLRSAANTLCARTSKRSTPNIGYKTHNHHHNYHRNNGSVIGTRHLINRNNQNNNNNVNNNHQHRNIPLLNGNFKNSVSPSGFIHMSPVTREVYNAWCGRLGDVTRIPSDSVQALFNDMQLYPSKNQVLEMLQCARQCGRRNSSQFLTFGEFCVFAGELRRGNRGRKSSQHHNNHHNNQFNHQQLQKVSKPLSQCEVFLGGSCNPTTWRADVAIPTFTKLGITYFNPQVSTWSPDLMAAEHNAKESAAVLLFVVDSQTRCVAGMLEVAYLIAKQRCLVIVVHPFTAGQSIMGEKISPQEFVDLSEGQSTLLTLVKNQGVVVHTNLTTALQCTVNILRGPDSVADTLAERKLTDKLIKLRDVFDSVDTNHTGELSLQDVSQAYYLLTGSNLRISDLRAIMDMSKQQSYHKNTTDDVRITFEQFCGIVAEFTTGEGCNVTASDNTGFINDGANIFTNTTYWKLALLRTQQLLRTYIVRPIVQIIDWIHQPLQRQSSTNNNSNYEPTNGNHYQNGSHLTNGHNESHYDIYLGGSCIKRTTWRQNVAIPLLKRYGVTYYNPSLHEENIDNEFINGDLNDNNTSTTIVRSASRDLLYDLNVMNDSKIVMFVITNETRSITSMILAAYYIALRKNVVLCVQQLPLEDCKIGTEMLTKQAIKDFNRARAYLTDLAKHENVPIFETVQEAIECAIDLVRTQTPTKQQQQQQQQKQQR